MNKQPTKYTSSQISEEYVRQFGAHGSRTFTVKMKHGREVGKFIKTIEDAHKRAANSKLVFR